MYNNKVGSKEKCQSDLATLVEWGNLTAQQASFKANTLQEFQNNKFRFQLNEYTVVIERMTLRLENLEIEGASLKPTLLERICNGDPEYDYCVDK